MSFPSCSSESFWCVYCIPQQLLSLFYLSLTNKFAFKWFWQTTLVVASLPWESSEFGKIKVSLLHSPSGNQQKGPNKQLQFFESKVCFAYPSTRNPHQGVQIGVFKTYWESVAFFLIKCLSDFCKPWTSLQSSDKVDFDSFCQIIYCFYAGTGPHSSLLFHFPWHSITLFQIWQTYYFHIFFLF